MENENKIILTRGVRLLFKEAELSLPEEDRENRYELLRAICFLAEERYTGHTMDYQLSRMGLATTGQILKKIDVFLVK